MCKAPNAYSDSVPVLNVMLCLSHWTWGHSKMKLTVQMIKKWSAKKKREVSHKVCLSNLTPLTVLLFARAEENKCLHFARLWVFSLAVKTCLFIWDFRKRRNKELLLIGFNPLPSKLNRPNALPFLTSEWKKHGKLNPLIFLCPYISRYNLVIK